LVRPSTKDTDILVSSIGAPFELSVVTDTLHG
jgi:hypothetical protein